MWKQLIQGNIIALSDNVSLWSKTCVSKLLSSFGSKFVFSIYENYSNRYTRLCYCLCLSSIWQRSIPVEKLAPQELKSKRIRDKWQNMLSTIQEGASLSLKRKSMASPYQFVSHQNSLSVSNARLEGCP